MKNTLIYLIMIFLLFSCISDVKTGIPFESSSIEMSKKNKVFISGYIPSFYEIEIKGSKVKIIEVWSEYSWYYRDTDMSINRLNNVSFIIRCDKEIDEITSLEAKRLGSKNTGLGITNYRLFTELTDYEQSKDTLVFLFKSDKGIKPIVFTKVK